MAGDLIQIGKAGTIAARTALELTAQNIANAGNETYARRTASMAEVMATGGVAYQSDSAPGGVRVDQVLRSDSLFLQNQARQSNADHTRVAAEVMGLANAEAAIEQAGIYPAIVEFEAALASLQGDPLNGSLRAAALESARTLAGTFNLADTALGQAGDQILFEATAGVDQVNLALGELARINSAVARTEPGTANHAALMDQRDAFLAQLSEQVGTSVTYQPSGAVEVRLGDAGGPLLISGAQVSTLSVAQNADGTLAYALNGNAVSPATGRLAGQAQALVARRDLGAELDTLAAMVIGMVNAAQASGTAPDGSPGAPVFSGTNAGDIAVIMASGAALASAPAGAGVNSRDTTNLEALRVALANNGPAAELDRILFQLSSMVQGRTTTRDALGTIAAAAQTALAAETGVDLDAEAANLVRFQQAFQASGRVIQVASDIFDTILGIR